jgi:hypothetical protein
MNFTFLRSTPDHAVVAPEGDTPVTNFKTGHEHQAAFGNWLVLSIPGGGARHDGAGKSRRPDMRSSP